MKDSFGCMFVFREVIGFRALDERDLCEFWNGVQHAKRLAVRGSDRRRLDGFGAQRRWFSSPEIFGDLREVPALVD